MKVKRCPLCGSPDCPELSPCWQIKKSMQEPEERLCLEVPGSGKQSQTGGGVRVIRDPKGL